MNSLERDKKAMDWLDKNLETHLRILRTQGPEDLKRYLREQDDERLGRKPMIETDSEMN
jgi:hypothetical protein